MVWVQLTSISAEPLPRPCWNVLQVTGRRCYNVSGTSRKLLDEDVTTYQERLASYCTKILHDLTTYKERLASYCTKILQHIRKSLLTTQTTGRCYTPLKTPSPKPPQKRQCTKVTTVPPLEGRRHLKHALLTLRKEIQRPKQRDLTVGNPSDMVT